MTAVLYIGWHSLDLLGAVRCAQPGDGLPKDIGAHGCNPRLGSFLYGIFVVMRDVLLLADANDAAQFAELKTQGDLTRRAWAKDVQV